MKRKTHKNNTMAKGMISWLAVFALLAISTGVFFLASQNEAPASTANEPVEINENIALLSSINC